MLEYYPYFQSQEDEFKKKDSRDMQYCDTTVSIYVGKQCVITFILLSLPIIDSHAEQITFGLRNDTTRNTHYHVVGYSVKKGDLQEM